ncbi:hypothetical protein [Spirillospora sp. NPDC048824]
MLAGVLEDSRGDEELPPEISQLQELDDDPFTVTVLFVLSRPA